MAAVTVTEAGFYAGRYLKAGQTYEAEAPKGARRKKPPKPDVGGDGSPVDEGSAGVDAGAEEDQGSVIEAGA